jgi:leucyl/phenylalanyl-tRNA--protein transferase
MSDERPSFTDPWPQLALGDGLGAPIAIGGELTAGSVLGAHRRAVFCQPRCDQYEIARDQATYAPDVRAGDIPILPGEGNPYATLWWSPAVRYVIPVRNIRISRSLRRTIRTSDWATTLDADFDGIIAGCRGDRKPRWITDELVVVLLTLKDAGCVHTVEVWEGEQLVGGLFGCVAGSVFVMESAFHRVPDASKVAIVDLAWRARDGGITLLDTEVKSNYTIQLGACPMPRQEYLTHAGADPGPVTIRGGRQSARRLLESPTSLQLEALGGGVTG